MTPMGWTHGDRTQMPRKKETTIRREPAPDHDTGEQLMVAAWPYCGVIQDIIDRLNETGSKPKLRLPAKRRQGLGFRAPPASSGEKKGFTPPPGVGRDRYSRSCCPGSATSPGLVPRRILST